MRMIAIIAISCSVVTGGRSLAASPQVELDRIVAEVNNRIITASDVRQARALALVEDVTSDDSVRRAIEDRLLILGEIARAPALVVSEADVVSRRSAWEARVGGHERSLALLGTAGMSDAALQTWMRDDARIEAYLKRQFGVVPEAERNRAADEWIVRLRQRAGMK